LWAYFTLHTNLYQLEAQYRNIACSVQAELAFPEVEHHVGTHVLAIAHGLPIISQQFVIPSISCFAIFSHFTIPNVYEVCFDFFPFRFSFLCFGNLNARTSSTKFNS